MLACPNTATNRLSQISILSIITPHKILYSAAISSIKPSGNMSVILVYQKHTGLPKSLCRVWDHLQHRRLSRQTD